MILETKTNKEYHLNGVLAYTETICYVSEATSGLYSNTRISLDGTKFWFRTGLHAKYYDNGQIAWKLEYDALGNTVGEHFIGRHKDGTFKTY